MYIRKKHQENPTKNKLTDQNIPPHGSPTRWPQSCRSAAMLRGSGPNANERAAPGDDDRGSETRSSKWCALAVFLVFFFVFFGGQMENKRGEHLQGFWRFGF